MQTIVDKDESFSHHLPGSKRKSRPHIASRGPPCPAEETDCADACGVFGGVDDVELRRLSGEYGVGVFRIQIGPAALNHHPAKRGTCEMRANGNETLAKEYPIFLRITKYCTRNDMICSTLCCKFSQLNVEGLNVFQVLVLSTNIFSARASLGYVSHRVVYSSSRRSDTYNSEYYVLSGGSTA